MPSDLLKKYTIWFPNGSVFAPWLGCAGIFVFAAWTEAPAEGPYSAGMYFFSAVSVIILAAGACNLPLAVVIDARAGEIVIRSLLWVKRIRMEEADEVKLLYHGESSRVYYALVFRKEVVRPPLRLCRSQRRTAKFIESFQQNTLHRIQELLALWRVRHPVLPSVPSPSGPPLWKRDNGGWRLTHPAANAAAGVIVALPVLLILAMAWLMTYLDPDGDYYSLEDKLHVSGAAAVILASAYLIAAAAFPADLRFDPENRKLVRRGWRSLFRKKHQAVDFESLTLHKEGDVLLSSGVLLLHFRNSKNPLLFFRSRSPEVLRQAVRETSALFGRDPQEFFVPHGREVKAEPLPR